ncbi:DUF5103 domain-containing protein [Hallella bergensis]|nr:DUF5103 domain-containing protein [Hallella bergensis]
MRNRFSLIILLVCMAFPVCGQRHEVVSNRIASLQVVAGDNWTELPVITLGQQTPVVISFDDLTHDYHRYVYKLEHCEADWTVSEEIFESDYCEGFARDNTIDDFKQSLNTNQLYTHYRLSLPNERCRIRIGGNYKVTVYDQEDENNVAFTACFMVLEPRMSVGMELTTNTDADINGRHQQLSVKVGYGSVRVTDPSVQVKTVMMQNGRWDNAVVNVKPQYINNNGLIWNHNRDLIFNGGNEYRKFEMLDMRHTTMGLESMTWDGKMYHATIWTDEPRPSYVYDEDADGGFYIRNADNWDNNVLSEYAMVHFRLASPRLPGEVYLNGAWTHDRFLPQYKMEWNETTQRYEASVWLKQGYYNYQYLLQQADGRMVPVPSEGNFYQTQNAYQVLVYFRGIGERTDRLVGYGKID